MHPNPALDYIDDVLSGAIPTNKYARAAVERHMADLSRWGDEDFPYFFDEEAAAHPIRFFSHLRHGKGKWRGKKYQLMPWWAFVLWVVYGWRHKENHALLRFTDIYIQVPRKNAKTENMAGVGIYEFFGRRIADPEVYWFATKKDQSKIGWDRQKEMTKMLRADSARFAKFCDTSTYRIFTREGLGFVAYLGKDSKGEDGPAPSCGIADEYHAHPNDDMVDVIQTGMGSRDGATMWRITTAGVNTLSPCKRFADYCKKVLDRTLPGESTFSIIYEMDDGDDWEDEAVWRKVNPSAHYVDTLMPYLRDQYEKAKERGGTKLTQFLVKNLNKWQSVGDKWLTDEDWMRGGDPIDITALAGRLCFGGLDLASTRDTTSYCLFFPPRHPGDRAVALWWYWLPEEESRIRERNDGVPYSQWAEEGYVSLTPGNSIDNDRIRRDLTGVTTGRTGFDEDCVTSRFKPHAVAYDRWNASDLIPRLIDDGLKMEQFGQGFVSMSAPTKKLEALVADSELHHGGNPVSRWQCSNIALEMDAAENIKISKRKSTEKVDGMVALVMAIGMWLDYEANKKDENSVYEKRELRFV